jgi:hypothetical protein
MVQTSSDSSKSVPLEDLDRLKILQWSLVITYMDKCCNNFVFVYKKFYVFFVFSEFNSLVWSLILPRSENVAGNIISTFNPKVKTEFDFFENSHKLQSFQ